MITSNGFLPLITRPSRAFAAFVTLIDNTFTNTILVNLFARFVCYWSVWPLSYLPYWSSSESQRDWIVYVLKDIQLFFRSFSGIDWSEIYRTSDIQKAFDQFHNNFLALHSRCFPINRVKINTKIENPGCLRRCKIPLDKKNKLYQKPKKIKPAYDEHAYKAYKNKL